MAANSQRTQRLRILPSLFSQWFWQFTVICALLVICIVIYLSTSETLISNAIKNIPSSLTSTNDKRPRCRLDASTLKHIKPYGAVDYARVDIQVDFSDKIEPQHHNVAELELPFPTLGRVHGGSIAGFEESDNSTLETGYCRHTTTLRVPQPEPKLDFSSFIFGLTISLNNLQESIETIAHWAGGTNADLIAIVEPDCGPGAEEIEQKAADHGFNLYVVESGHEDYDSRYFSMIGMLHRNRDKKRHKWVGFLDENTFFLSPQAIVDRLARFEFDIDGKGYGAEQYVGGVFISMPLLEFLDQKIDVCERTDLPGPSRIEHCIREWVQMKPIWDYGLHQPRLEGDTSGLYESGHTHSLALYRWKFWSEFNVRHWTSVAQICGSACLLQRLRFSDGWYLTNGFSIVKYSKGLRVQDKTMEKTWGDWQKETEEDHQQNLAPLRPKDNNKISYRLDQTVLEDSVVRQFYVHRPGRWARARVVEVAWQPRP